MCAFFKYKPYQYFPIKMKLVHFLSGICELKYKSSGHDGDGAHLCPSGAGGNGVTWKGGHFGRPRFLNLFVSANLFSYWERMTSSHFLKLLI